MRDRTPSTESAVAPVVVTLPEFLVPAYTMLQRGRRMLDDLRDAEARHPSDQHGFTDRLPYVLDLLDEVTGLIDSCSKGHRTPAFSQWWHAVDRTKRDELHQLRVAELKRAERRTSRMIEYRIVDAITVNDDLSIRLTRPDGTTHDVVDNDGNPAKSVVFARDGSDHPNNLPATPTDVSITYRFVGGMFYDEPVLDVLEAYWNDLHDRVLPHAAKRLSG
jgi:hypothetical protein